MIAPACVWSATSDGKVVCQTRSALHTAVMQATRLPGGYKRTAAVEAAMEAHEAHHCGPAEEVRKGGDAPRSPDGGSWSARGSRPNAERSAPTSAVTRIELDRLHQACVDAAISWAMRMERRAHPDTPAGLQTDIDAASRRMAEAHAAYHRALDAYRPGRQPISAFLPPNEEPAA